MTLEDAMVVVWRAALVEGRGEVELEGQKFAVRETPRKRLREVDFVFGGQVIRGVEQKSRDGITLGAIGARRTQSNAVSCRRAICRQCGGRQSDEVRRQKKERGKDPLNAPW